MTSLPAPAPTPPQRSRSPSARLAAWYAEAVTRKSFIGQFLRKWRRLYLGTFRKDYVARSVAETRTGQCNRCGACCELIFKCPFLGRDSQNMPYCRVYGDLRPASCHVYPFDAIDSEVEKCGFKFIQKS